MAVITEARGWDEMSKGAKDIVLHADNDRHLHRSSHEPIMKNLSKKMANGVYDSDKATKLWGYHADRAAMSCCKQHGGGTGVWHKMFSTADRKQAAAHWEALHRDNLQEGLNENIEFPVEDEENADILGMIQSAFEDKPATFAEHFANAIQPRIADHIEALKGELKKFIFNHSQGNFMEGMNCKSKMLLSAKASKTAWPGGQVPALTVATSSSAPADFSPEGTVGTQHENSIHATIHPDDKTGV
jgi:hypothetical protein